jgi:hypothetical protein
MQIQTGGETPPVRSSLGEKSSLVPYSFMCTVYIPTFDSSPVSVKLDPSSPPSFLAIENLQNHFILQIINFTSL